MDKLTEYRNRQKPTAELTLPSGLTITMQRPRLQVWLASGRLPQAFMTWLNDVKHNPQAEISDTELADGMKFLHDAIIECAVEPRIVRDSAAADEGLRFSELDEADFMFLSGWIASGAPGVPVPTKGGETSIESLGQFRQKKPGGGFADAGSHRPEVFDAPVETAGAA